jgi:hypothetical protein
MGLSSQPDQVLDQRFFHITGLAMVLGTLVAGAITVWLANDIRPTEIPVLITDNIARQTSALKKPEKFPDPITEL